LGDGEEQEPRRARTGVEAGPLESHAAAAAAVEKGAAAAAIAGDRRSPGAARVREGQSNQSGKGMPRRDGVWLGRGAYLSGRAPREAWVDGRSSGGGGGAFRIGARGGVAWRRRTSHRHRGGVV